MATAVTPIRDIDDLNDQGVVKVVLDREGRAMYFSRLPIPCMRDGDPLLTSNLYMRHLGIYAYRGGFLRKFISERPCMLEKAEKLEQLRALWMGATISVIRTKDDGIGVDTPEDAERVEEILRQRGLAK
jgi:3-deoxy-manno-octulosonate cytidylyltransferase (CMP-KDO synthetase)